MNIIATDGLGRVEDVERATKYLLLEVGALRATGRPPPVVQQAISSTPLPSAISRLVFPPLCWKKRRSYRVPTR